MSLSNKVYNLLLKKGEMTAEEVSEQLDISNHQAHNAFSVLRYQLKAEWGKNGKFKAINNPVRIDMRSLKSKLKTRGWVR